VRAGPVRQDGHVPAGRGVAGAVDLRLDPAHHHLPLVGVVVAHHALHQGALPRAVLAQQGMDGPALQPQPDVVQRHHGPEVFTGADHLQRGRDGQADGLGGRYPHAHGSASSSASSLDTEPNTPFCIFTILRAAR